MKIYSGDPLVHYATTELSSERTKAQIDGILAEYQVKDVLWHYDIPREAYVIFKIEETINERPVKVGVKVVCPAIWDRERPRARPPRLEEINWKVSMRAMYWFIKTHLETAYAMQSGKAVAFLPFIQSSNPEKTLKDYILPRLSEYTALEAKIAQTENNKIVDAEFTLVKEAES